MLEQTGRPTIRTRLAAATAHYPVPQADAIADIVQCVLATMRGTLTATEATLLAEVEELGRTIAAAKAEIAALKFDDITASHIPSATDELDAIVAHTAAATDAILESCETLDKVGAEVSGTTQRQLQDATTRIYEACSFQDITGQRITKVVAALKAIDKKVTNIVAAFGDHSHYASEVVPQQPELLNGPQLPACAMDQGDIDKLLASFD